jgi:plastocyanin
MYCNRCLAAALALATVAGLTLAQDKDKAGKKDDKEVVITIAGKGAASKYFDDKGKNEPVTVTVGQKVTWVNKSSAPHTATSDKEKEKHKPVFTTKTLKKGESDSVTFDEAMYKALGGKDGKDLEVTYLCEVHPSMQGKLILKPAVKKDKK